MYIVDSTDTGCSDYYLVWIELGRTTKTTRKAKRVIRKWSLERFEDKEVKSLCWAFVWRITKGKKWNIAALRNEARVSVTSTKRMLKKAYEQLV